MTVTTDKKADPADEKTEPADESTVGRQYESEATECTMR